MAYTKDYSKDQIEYWNGNSYTTADTTGTNYTAWTDWNFRTEQPGEWREVLRYELNNHIKECKLEKENTRMLYEVYIYDPEAERIIHRWVGAAKDESTAQMKAWQDRCTQTFGVGESTNVEDYDFVCNELGTVRAKKEVQEVKIIDK